MGGGGGGLTWTDRARLSSLISEVRSTLATALGLPLHGGEGRKEYNPRGEVIEPRLKPLEVEMSNGEEGQGEPGALDLEHRYVVEEQEDRAEDEEGDMDVDDEDEVRIVEEGEDSDEDDFEEVDVSPEPPSQQPGSALSPSAQPHESFSVSFHATPPPPISADVEEAPREEPPAAQDPDDEYGLDVEGEEDEVDRGVKVESEKVFEGAIAELKRMGGAKAS